MSSIFIQSKRPFCWKTSWKSKRKYVDSSIVNRFIFRLVFLKINHTNRFLYRQIFMLWITLYRMKPYRVIFFELYFLFHIFNFLQRIGVDVLVHELKCIIKKKGRNDFNAIVSQKFSILIHNDLNWCIFAFIVESVQFLSSWLSSCFFFLFDFGLNSIFLIATLFHTHNIALKLV